MASFPSREYLIGMLVPVLVTMRHVTLSNAGGANWVTTLPSTSRILSPGRNPACHAGPGLPAESVLPTQPIVVESFNGVCSGLPTQYTMNANAIASKKLNSGP